MKQLNYPITPQYFPRFWDFIFFPEIYDFNIAEYKKIFSCKLTTSISNVFSEYYPFPSLCFLLFLAFIHCHIKVFWFK